MAIVIYKCDVCKREKEFKRNIEGLEKIQRCTITHGCRGKLFSVKVLDDYIRASAPESVLGLDDWRQRKVLYDHVQSIARDKWIIEHNLGTFPSISVFINAPTSDDPENVEEIIPTDVVIVDENNMILVFEDNDGNPNFVAGLAQLVARQSDPNLLKPFTRVIDTSTQDLQQISNLGEITIATRISTVEECPIINLQVSYNTTQNTIVEKTYPIDENLSNSSSTWRDFDKVVIKGKIYTIRSYQGVDIDMENETIGSGSTFRFTNITPCPSGSPPSAIARPISQDEVYILYASEPFATVDKLTDQYIDVFDITALDNTFSLLYNTGEFFAQKNIIQQTYPAIRTASITPTI